MMSSDGSITGYIHEIERGGNRDEAARLLWERFANELARHAVRRLRLMHVPRAVADEEDVVERAFTKVFHGIESGQLKLQGRTDLHRLLLVATAREAINLLQRVQPGDRGLGDAVPHELVSDEQPPDLSVLALEACRDLLDLLDDKELRRIALWKLVGHTNDEIRAELGYSLAKLERKLDRIRRKWAALAPGVLAVPGPRGPSAGTAVVGTDNTTAILRNLGGRS
jgi:DNA-directed RNA polymerase specialized sigma24 family protein